MLIKSITMKLGPELIRLLNKPYEGDRMINMKFKGLDIAFKTNEAGDPVTLFLGKLNEQGQITGSRYIRTLKKDQQGRTLKDHWELKGKAT